MTSVQGCQDVCIYGGSPETIICKFQIHYRLVGYTSELPFISNSAASPYLIRFPPPQFDPGKGDRLIQESLSLILRTMHLYLRVSLTLWQVMALLTFPLLARCLGPPASHTLIYPCASPCHPFPGTTHALLFRSSAFLTLKL